MSFFLQLTAKKRNQIFFSSLHKFSFLTNDFKNNVNVNKQNSKKFILIENLSSNFITKDDLIQKFRVAINRIWSWNYRKRNFILIDLEKLEDVTKFQESCGYNLHAIPVKTRMLESNFNEFTMARNQLDYFQYNNVQNQFNCSELKQKYNNKEFINFLDQINTMSDLDLHLRYFIITQLEEILCQSVFSGFQIYPFGSSFAGLGDSKSDLDLVLLHSNLKLNKKINFSMTEIKSERDQMQQCLSLIADIMRHFVPNFSQINRILRARVPIVKMSFDLSPIDIDISIELSEESAHHGIIIANYISYCINSNPIIKKFFNFLKLWAKRHTIVRNIAGNWFSNFQIIVLGIYFLQTQKIILPIQEYKKNHEEFSEAIDFNKLLYDFFEFLISFNFEKNAISIDNGQKFSKPDFSPLFIENPIEKDLNICKNVSGLEFKKLLLQAYNSIDAMHCENFHLADLLDPEYFKKLEKQTRL